MKFNILIKQRNRLQEYLTKNSKDTKSNESRVRKVKNILSKFVLWKISNSQWSSLIFSLYILYIFYICKIFYQRLLILTHCMWAVSRTRPFLTIVLEKIFSENALIISIEWILIRISIPYHSRYYVELHFPRKISYSFAIWSISIQAKSGLTMSESNMHIIEVDQNLCLS